MSRGGGRMMGGGTRGHGKFGPPQPKDVLTPTLAPTYPPAPKACPPHPKIVGMVPTYINLSQYFFSNYKVTPRVAVKSAFIMDRYTDRYNAPLAMNLNIQYRLNPSRLCKELLNRRIPVKTVCKKRKLKVPSLATEAETEENQEEEEEEAEADQEAKRVKLTEAQGEETETAGDEEELDLEMDLGTDYAAAYFDNGEGYLDSDEDNLDDGPVY